MIIQFINELQPVHWATLGVLLIAADLFVLSSFHMAFVGLMAFGIAVIDALGASPEVQAWSLVLGTPLVVAVSIRLINGPAEVAPLQPHDALVGQSCKVTAINPDDPRKGMGHVAHHGEWPIEAPLHDLEVHSILIVTAIRGNSLEVARPAQ
jgi:membrane protein implicated in regulation of membrane protease activity